MDYGGAFTYMFSSDNWLKKIVLGVAMSLAPILGPLVLLGWSLDVLRNLSDEAPDPIPDWTGDDFARWLGRGLGLNVALLTFFLPVLVIVILLTFCSLALGTWVGSEFAEAGGFISVCLSCLGIILYFLVSLGAQVVFVRYASTDRLDVGLDYAQTFQLVSANIVPLLIITILLIIAAIGVALLGVLTLGIFLLVAPVYFSLIFAYFGAELSFQPGFID